MARETLKDFLNSNGIQADSISYNLDNSSGDPIQISGLEDLGKDPNTNRELLDLDNETSGLLGDYLSYIVENSNSIFGIAPGNERATSSKRGDSLVLAEEQGADKVFLEQGTENANNFNKNSNSQQFGDSGSRIGTFIDKTGNSSNSHNLYKDIIGTGLGKEGETFSFREGDANNKVVKATQNLMLKNNRFANVVGGDAHAPKNIQNENLEKKDVFLINNQFGVHDKEKYFSTIEQLKDIGSSLLLKASGYDFGDSPGESKDIKEAALDFREQDLKSSRFAADRFIKVNNSILDAKNAKGFTEDELGNSVREGRGRFLNNDPDAESSKTFGQTYNSEINFDGKNHRLHKLQAAIACKALMSLSENFYKQILEYFIFKDKSIMEDAKGVINRDNYDTSAAGTFILGKARSLFNLRLDLLKQLILVKTRYPYKACVDRGLKIIFGTGNENDIAKRSHIRQAPGYWLSIASSMLKTYNQLIEDFKELSEIRGSDSEQLLKIMNVLKKNKVVGFYNVMATIGDVSFQAFSGQSEDLDFSKIKHPKDVDSLPDGPGTRHSKSRKDFGFHDKQLAWAQNETPSAYLLPVNVVRAATRLDNVVFGPNPFKAMMGSDLVKNTYLAQNNDGSGGRIPQEVVKGLEDRLDAEYVPFYIQDLRTNEVISFHAFLSELSDSIQPNYTPTSGYGRLDKVRIYSDTTRSVNLTFTLFATSKEDFNTMWYKINKLSTLFYPQWSKGTEVGRSGDDNSRFIQPFSQVLGGSPIIRLRVGDVIKSNYSRFGLSRMFGIGDPGTLAVPSEGSKLIDSINGKKAGIINKIKDFGLNTLVGVFGSPIQFTQSPAVKTFGEKNIFAKKATNLLVNGLTEVLANGFVNPLTYGLIYNQLIDPNASRDFTSDLPKLNLLDGLGRLADNILNNSRSSKFSGYPTFAQLLLKANNSVGYKVYETGEMIYLQRPIKVTAADKILFSSSGEVEDESIFKNKTSKTKPDRFKTGVIKYKAKIIDFTVPPDLRGKHLICEHADIIPEPGEILLNTYVISSLLGIAGGGIGPLADYFLRLGSDAVNSTGLGSAIDIVRTLYASDETLFMDPFNNPITRAYETNIGRGLAGTLGGVTFNWLEFPWETDHNSRAPMGVKIQLKLDVIHDLPPGLDHSGYNRAPLYNVGEIMKGVAGDPHPDNGDMSELRYRNEGNASIKREGKKE